MRTILLYPDPAICGPIRKYLRQIANGVVVDGAGTPETLAVVLPFHHLIQTGYAGNAHSQ